MAVFWEQEPSRVPLIGGARSAPSPCSSPCRHAIGIAWLAAVIGDGGRWNRLVAVVSVPPETGPSSISWLLPAIAAASAVVAVTLGRSLVSHALVVLGRAAARAVGVRPPRRPDQALLPTDAPFWLDRGVTAAAAVVGAAGIIAGVLEMLRLPTAQT